MKKCILSAIASALAMLIVITIVTTLQRNKEQFREEYKHIDYISSITQEGCYVCSDTTDFVGSFYWGEDNVGIVNLNTFELLHLEINRYDDYGNLITEPAGFMTSGGLQKDDAGSSAHAFTFSDNGYADVQIFDAQYSIDRISVQNHLCQACLDTINDLWIIDQPPAEYAIISFEERTIYPILNTTPWFSAGNYGVDCEFKTDGNIDILIHYIANRFGEVE